MNPLVWPWTMTILSQPSATKTPAAKQNCCASIESFLKTRLNAIPSLIPSEDMAGWQPIATNPSKMLSMCSPVSGVPQSAVKCRGPEYLRIIYGPEYLLPENLEWLRSRGVGAKRSLASREFALGIEALERFVRREPLRRVHECVFGVLALESEPVDPRL